MTSFPQKYANALSSSSAINQDTIHVLFPGLSKLLDFQRRFLITLEGCVELPWKEQRWGMHFTRNVRCGLVTLETKFIDVLLNPTSCLPTHVVSVVQFGTTYHFTHYVLPALDSLMHSFQPHMIVRIRTLHPIHLALVLSRIWNNRRKNLRCTNHTAPTIFMLCILCRMSSTVSWYVFQPLPMSLPLRIPLLLMRRFFHILASHHFVEANVGFPRVRKGMALDVLDVLSGDRGVPFDSNLVLGFCLLT